MAKRIHDSFTQSLRQSMRWNAISDEAYLAARRELIDS